jgi:hypothetical protein
MSSAFFTTQAKKESRFSARQAYNQDGDRVGPAAGAAAPMPPVPRCGRQAVKRRLVIAAIAAICFFPVASRGQLPRAAALPEDLPWCDPSGFPVAIPVSPNGSLAYVITIICDGRWAIGSRVEIRFTHVADTLVCWCNSVPGPRPHSFFAYTNSMGVATFNIAAGGCIPQYSPAIPGPRKFAAEIFADGMKMQECGIVSPDACDAAGRLTISSPTWEPGGACAVGLSDAVYHTMPIGASAYDWCTDINGDHAVGLTDAAILTPYLAAASSCAGNAGP